MEKLKVIVTGATGMVGEGVLHECLQSPLVEEVLVIGRKPCGVTHAKLKEIVHADFYNIAPIQDKLRGYNACFFCLGVSSLGKTEEEYFKLTYTITMHMAETLARQNPEMAFLYISGVGTDSTEGKGPHPLFRYFTSRKSAVEKDPLVIPGPRPPMWSRVKGKTENDLMRLPFKKVYAVRPGYLHPTPGLRYTQKYYKWITWVYPMGRAFFPNMLCSLKELGLAMIRAAASLPPQTHLEVKDIVELAKQ